MEEKFGEYFSSLKDYAYILLFLFLLLENTLFVGFIVPGITVLIFSGTLLAFEQLNPFLAFLYAFFGTLVGDNLNYLLGRFGVNKFKKLSDLVEMESIVKTFILKNNFYLFIFFHFPFYLRTLFPLVLGAYRFNFTSWIVIDLVGAVLFVIVYLSLGYFAGSLFDNISDSYGIGESFTVVMTLLSIFTIIIGIYKYKKKEKHKSD